MATVYNNFKGIKNPTTGDVLTNPVFAEDFYVNGVKTTPTDGVVSLASGATYHLTGRLYGKLVIGAATETELTADTFVILDGVEVFSTEEVGIHYASESKAMYVTLAKNKKNLIVCSKEQEMAEQQGAALYSSKNMAVQGVGYLTVINKGGHGIKASELRFSGYPHIYAEAIHDAIHGNSVLDIDNGIYYVNKANDAFGTGSTGRINVFGGEFHCFNIAQNAFDSKVNGWIYCGTIELYTDAPTPVSGLFAGNPTTMFGVPFVKVNGVEIESVDGSYIINEGVEPEITVTGHIGTSISVGVAKAKVVLNNCYVDGGIEYTLGSSNIQINAAEDTVNYILKGITSSNNVKLESKVGSHLVIIPTYTHAISGSEITIHDTKGSIIIKECSGNNYSIIGTDIYFADSADHKTFDDEAICGSIVCDNIYARLSGKGKKANVTVKNENMKGCLLCNTIDAETGSTDTTGIRLGGSKHVFITSAVDGDLIIGNPGMVYQPYDAIPYGIGTFPL